MHNLCRCLQRPNLVQAVPSWNLSKGSSSSLVYSPFSDKVGFPLHNIPSSGVLMKSIGTVVLRPDALPGVNQMRGMQYHIVINITIWPELN